MKQFLQGQFRRQVGATFFTQLMSLIFSITTAAIIARWLGPEGKGILTMALLVPGTLVIFLSFGIEAANVYFVGSKRFDVSILSKNSVTFTFLATWIGTGVIVGLLSLKWLEKILPDVPTWFVLIALIGFPIGLLSVYLNSILQGLQSIIKVNIINLTKGGLILALTFLFVVTLKIGLLGALIAHLGAGILCLAVLTLVLQAEGGTFIARWNPAVMCSTISFGLKGHVGNILQFFNYRLDMFFVNFFLGPAGVGIYTVSVSLAELLWYLPNAVGFVIFPKSASSQPEVMNLFVPRVFRITLILTALGAIGLVFLGKHFIQWIFSPLFDSAYFPMVVLLPGVVLLGGAKVLSNDLAGRGYPQYNSINAGVAAILTVILDLVLIPSYGVMGAAIASSIAYGVIFLMAFCFHRIVSRRVRGVLCA